VVECGLMQKVLQFVWCCGQGYFVPSTVLRKTRPSTRTRNFRFWYHIFAVCWSAQYTVRTIVKCWYCSLSKKF